ncbi:MAG: hypothetical protein ACYTJ0_14440 [Planctomycetota bacterium]|jgi:hypothetical protein
MNTERIIWIVVFVVAGLFLVYRAAFTELGMGKAYVHGVEVNADDPDPDNRWVRYDQSTYTDWAAAEAANPGQTEYQFSVMRTIGIWLAAFFTLAIFSFVYKDNAFYKFAESVFIGVSAAYWMVIGFWTVIVPNLFGKIWPGLVQSWAMPGLEAEGPELIYLIPLVLGIMLLWRLMPVGGWISRWPLAFIIGVFCGLRLVTFLHADFLSQIRNTIMPLIVMENGAFDIWGSLRSFFIVFGVLACLVYFFFSFEHKGFVGRTAKVGIWVLMITFGAGFGYTVMGRIALLAIRLEFLFDDWLWLIDPTGRRAAEVAGLLLLM